MGALNMLVALFIGSLVSLAAAWPYDNEYTAWRLARRSYCVGGSGKCFSTTQCCKGFVCAAFDDYFDGRQEGENPEIPGVCVKEKDLSPCYSNGDCRPGSKCLSLGRGGENYCVPRPEAEETVAQALEEKILSKGMGRSNFRKPGGDIGADCNDDTDCKAISVTNEKLCCQRRSRGRQAAKQICDRVTPISKCIANRK